MIVIGVAVLMVGVTIVGSHFTERGLGWYETLEKPTSVPPRWVFGPVWGFLYALIGFALWAVLQSSQEPVLLGIFAVQLGLNIGWSYVFFARQSLRGGLVAIGLLLVAISINGWSFYQVDPLAGYVFIPYFFWVVFAGYVNYEIMVANREPSASTTTT